MSFSFGNTQTQQPTLGFGATPAKTGFGTNFSFGGTAATTTTPSTGFTGFGSTFGAPAASTSSAFGTSFGAPATSTSTGFGTTFGAQPATSTTPAFGTAFGGLSTNTAAPSFGSSFATPATTANTGFGLFGSAPAPTISNLFSGFVTTNTAPTATGFGGFGANTSLTNTGFGGFGTATTTSSAFSGFGAKPATTGPAFGGFGTSLGGTLGQPSLFQQQQQQQPQSQLQQQQQQAAEQSQAYYNSVFNVTVFGDDRDAVLAKWNLLQASWGTGKGYYSQSQPPVDYTLQNPYCRFKAVGYSIIPGHDNKEGYTAIVFTKKETEVKAQKDQLTTSLNTIMGNKPNLSVSIYNIRAIGENKTQVIVFIEEKSTTGALRKIPATDLTNYLLQPMQKQQLGSLGVENVFAHIKPDNEQLKEYLAKAPTGIDIRIWKQAQLDNPNPNKYIPVPLVGFEQLKWRSKCQEKETALHRGFLDQVSNDIIELKRRHTASVAQIMEQKRKLVELQHRVLRILVRQEITRKAGIALQSEEEVLKGQLENMQTQLNIPTQFKGRLNDLLAQIRMLNNNGQVCISERYTMDSSVQEDIKHFLCMEQDGISHLIDIINTDLEHVKIIRDEFMPIIKLVQLQKENKDSTSTNVNILESSNVSQ